MENASKQEIGIVLGLFATILIGATIYNGEPNQNRFKLSERGQGELMGFSTAMLAAALFVGLNLKD